MKYRLKNRKKKIKMADIFIGLLFRSNFFFRLFIDNDLKGIRYDSTVYLIDGKIFFIIENYYEITKIIWF